MLPPQFMSYRVGSDKIRLGNCRHRLQGNGDDPNASDLNTEADARAKMLIYLIENGVIQSTTD